jgi:hypothetical protein
MLLFAVFGVLGRTRTLDLQASCLRRKLNAAGETAYGAAMRPLALLS